MPNIPAKKPTAKKPKKPETAYVSAEPEALSRNPELPNEVTQFRVVDARRPPLKLNAEEWVSSLYGTEIQDKNQQIKLRPYFAAGVFILIVGQSVGVWFIVVWALQAKELKDLQPLLGTLIAGTLTQSYFILKFITEKVFSNIDYHNGDSKR